MEKQKWRDEIVRACQGVGTYRPQFDQVIDTLAGIMEERDKVHEQYIATGAHPTVIHTNKAKEQNIAKNPMLVMEMDLNTQALAYWKELGLTPGGLRRLNAQVVEERNKTGGLEKLLEGLSDA